MDHPDLAPHILKGWNFVPQGSRGGTPPPSVGSPEYSNYNDVGGHGTHTAGAIAAVGNNGMGVAGVAWNVSTGCAPSRRGSHRGGDRSRRRPDPAAAHKPTLAPPAPCRSSF